MLAAPGLEEEDMKKAIVFGAMTLVAAACGGKSADTQTVQQAAEAGKQAADATRQGAATAQQGAEQMAQGFQQMAQGLQQMAKNATKPVDYEELKALLPEIDGWKRTDLKGEQMTMPFPFSHARARYEKDDSRLELEITDSTASQIMLAPLAMFMSAGYEEKSDDGYKKATKVAGSPAFEDWDRNSRHAEVTVVVSSRFIVKSTGSRVDSVDPVRQALEKIDLAKLAGVK
jgi:hypothetical protein